MQEAILALEDSFLIMYIVLGFLIPTPLSRFLERKTINEREQLFGFLTPLPTNDDLFLFRKR